MHSKSFCCNKHQCRNVPISDNISLIVNTSYFQFYEWTIAVTIFYLLHWLMIHWQKTELKFRKRSPNGTWNIVFYLISIITWLTCQLNTLSLGHRGSILYLSDSFRASYEIAFNVRLMQAGSRRHIACQICESHNWIDKHFTKHKPYLL